MILKVGRRFFPAGRAFLLSLCLLLCAAATAPAQTPGQQEAAKEKQGEAALKSLSASPVAPVTKTLPAAPATSGPKVMVRRIIFSGHSAFDDATLSGLIAADLNRQLSLAELKSLASKVADFYHEKGYFLAQVLVPEQTISSQNNTARFTVLEGRLGQINITGNRRYGEKYIRRAMSVMEPGKPIRRQNLERALRVLNETSGIKVGSVLKAGKETGSTDITIEVTEGRELLGTLEAHNFDLKNSDQYRLTPGFSLPNVSGRGDSLDMSFNVTPASGYTNYGQISHSLPIGYRGLQLKSFAAAGRFEVAREFAVLDIKGDNIAWGLGLTYPYLLTAARSKSWEAWLESRDAEQSMLGTVTSNDQIRKVRIGYNIDSQGARGRTLFSLGVHQGLGEMLGGMPDDSTLSSRSFARADNDFTKVTADLTRVERLSSRLFIIGRLAGQYSAMPLVAGEQWSIGGANSVRGHVQSAWLGDDGYTATLEGRLALTPDNSWQMAAFVDHGRVHVKKPLLGQEKSTIISGAGIGLRTSLLRGLDLRLDWGLPLGEHAGNDSMLYAQSIYNF